MITFIGLCLVGRNIDPLVFKDFMKLYARILRNKCVDLENKKQNNTQFDYELNDDFKDCFFNTGDEPNQSQSRAVSFINIRVFLKLW